MGNENKKITDYDEFVEALGDITDNIDTSEPSDCLISIGCFQGHYLAQGKGSIQNMANAMATVFAESNQVFEAAKMAVLAICQNGDEIKDLVERNFDVGYETKDAD